MEYQLNCLNQNADGVQEILETPLLDRIAGPLDVKRLTLVELTALCTELREVIERVVARNGGHLSSNLGVVELTVALHSAFESPIDRILFDVGHQSYVHKLLTGRRQCFHTLRTFNGLAGFPRPNESPHDPFVAGHSSTALSAGGGIAAGLRLLQQPGFTVVVVGDGALTGGLAYEGLNNAAENGRLIVVLNDNDNSIGKNVGSVARMLSRTTSRPSYFKLKDATREAVQAFPLLGDSLYRLVSGGKRLAKDAIMGSDLFESLGFEYFGPIDGHDIRVMTDVFGRARRIGKPALIHVKTTKGKGLPCAEQNPGRYHGVAKPGGASGSFSKVFGERLCQLAERDSRVTAITAAMTDGLSLQEFAAAYPNRFFDVGIAEQHAVTFAAGLASTGMRPFFAVYSSFLQRAYDQLVHDVALPHLPVVLAIDRAGLVGEDGDTHQGLFDVSFLRPIPGMTIYSPSDYVGLLACLDLALATDGPVALRYPRGVQPTLPQGEPLDGCVLYGRRHPDILLVTYGRLTANCIEAMALLSKAGIVSSVLSLHRIHPLDPDVLQPLCSPYGQLLFVEEGMRTGGVGEALLLQLLLRGAITGGQVLAVEGFVPHGSVEQLTTALDFHAHGIAGRAMALLRKPRSGVEVAP